MNDEVSQACEGLEEDEDMVSGEFIFVDSSL
jgi:hypothetical protein